jgi:hypothetical protein
MTQSIVPSVAGWECTLYRGIIEREMYHQVFKIHYYAGKHSAESNREINYSLKYSVLLMNWKRHINPFYGRIIK